MQATCHGADNRAAGRCSAQLERTGARCGDGEREVTDTDLQALHAAGVRGVRFNFVKRLVDIDAARRAARNRASRAPLGWHVVIYFEARNCRSCTSSSRRFRRTVVIDHMGRPDVTQPVDGAGVRAVREAACASDRNFWSKVSCPERLSRTGPPAATRMLCHSRVGSWKLFPIACCGVRTGRIRT